MLYEDMMKRKENGEKFNWEDIDYETLYQLALVENKADFLIADLFDTSKEKVRYKRYKWDMKINGANLFMAQLSNYMKSFS